MRSQNCVPRGRAPRSCADGVERAPLPRARGTIRFVRVIIYKRTFDASLSEIACALDVLETNGVRLSTHSQRDRIRRPAVGDERALTPMTVRFDVHPSRETGPGWMDSGPIFQVTFTRAFYRDSGRPPAVDFGSQFARIRLGEASANKLPSCTIEGPEPAVDVVTRGGEEAPGCSSAARRVVVHPTRRLLNLPHQFVTFVRACHACLA